MSRFPYQVQCPTCGSGPGWPCTDFVGNILTSFHGPRTDYAAR